MEGSIGVLVIRRAAAILCEFGLLIASTNLPTPEYGVSVIASMA